MPRQQEMDQRPLSRSLQSSSGDLAPEPRFILDVPEIAQDPAAEAIARKLAEEAGNWRAASRGEVDLAPEDDPTGHA